MSIITTVWKVDIKLATDGQTDKLDGETDCNERWMSTVRHWEDR